MANVPGPQPDVIYCPHCKGDLRNVPGEEMKSGGYVRRDGTVSEHARAVVADAVILWGTL